MCWERLGFHSTMKKIGILILLLAISGCGKKIQSTHSLRDAKGGKKYGGTIHLNETGDLRSLDPPQINDQTSSHVGENIYDRLLEFDSALHLHPALANALPEISSDGLNYTFHLRTDVYFQDDECFPNSKGRKMAAKDI